MCPVDGWATVPYEAKDVQLTPGTTLLGRFTIEAFVDNDGAVANYRAHDPAKNVVRVALIAVPQAAGGAANGEGERMALAAQALERLQHKAIAKVLASGLSDAGELVIVSEQIDGQSLEEAMRKGPLGSERAMELGVALFGALEAANQQGLAHHDLAPARVQLASDGRVVVCEMGYADLLRGPDALEESPTLARGAAYRAPEQARARTVTHHADIYSVGAILFEVLTGKVFGSTVAAATPGSLTMPIATTVPIAVTSPLPFAVDKKVEAGATKEARVESGAALTLPGAGHGLNLLRVSTIETPIAEFVARCLEKKPWNRYDTATIAREALEAVRDAVEAAGPIGRVKLGELAWDAPQPESATRESSRPDHNMSGLLSVGPSWPTTEKDASRPRAVVPDIEPVAPIARTVSPYTRPRRSAWWLVAVAGVLVAGGIGLALGLTAGDEHPDPNTVAAIDVERAAQESAAKIAAREAKIKADMQARVDQQARLAKDEADAKAREEARLRAAKDEADAKALAKAKAEAEAKALAEAPMMLEAVGPEDGEAKALSAEARAAADAKAKREAEIAAKAAREAEAKARVEAAAQAKIDAQLAAKAKREAEVKAKADAIIAAKAQRAADAKAKADAIVAAKAEREAEAKAKRDATAAAKREATAAAEREAQAKLAAAKAPVVAEATGKKTWAQIREEEQAANLEIARKRTEAATKARLEREAKEAEAARAAQALREAREAAWKKKVEENERTQKAIEEQRKADIEARRQARLEAEAAKKAEAEKLAKAAKTAKAEKDVAEDPSLYRALLSTVPAGASVLVDGGLIGKTPLTLTWKPGAVKHVWVMLEGHTPTGFDVGDAQNTKMLRLELVPVAVEKPTNETPEEP